ncbi:hypothetical protein FQN54_006598 [Arachnomyces sp. PD_36]|nr:hypothetical protein FQN54_006598 [Arachnomyces sp. PD_36]
MPAKLYLTAEDLEYLRPKDLEGVTWIQPVDEEKWTERDYERLKDVVDRRGKEHEIEATELQRKLEAFPSSPRPQNSSSSSTSTAVATPIGSPVGSPPSPGPVWKEVSARHNRTNAQAYYELIEAGGRPAFPLQVSRARPGNYGDYEDAVKHWGMSYIPQKYEWTSFREFQRRRRKNAESFAQYLQEVHEYRKREGIEGDIQLLFDAHQQTKVDEWKEFHYSRHKWLSVYKERAQEGRRIKEEKRKEWEQGGGNQDKPYWLFDLKCREEINLERLVFLVNWIEGELPKIAKENGISLPEVPDDVSNPKSTEKGPTKAPSDTKAAEPKTSKRKSPISTDENRQKSKIPASHPIDISTVDETGGDTPSPVANPHTSTVAPEPGAPPAQEAPGRKKPPKLAKTKAAAKPSCEPVTLRRSKRLLELAKKKKQ